MSEEYYQKKSKAPLVITIVVAVLAVLAVAALIFVLKQKPEEDTNTPDSDNGFTVTHEFQLECQYAAHDLLQQSFDVMNLFVFEGLSHIDEPYGNEPEDGLYTVYVDDSSKYKTYEDVENLVKSVYTDEAAEKVLHNIDGNGFEVYQKRNVLVNAEYDSEAESGESRPMYVEEQVLGINAEFVPDTSRREFWANTSIMVTPTSETNCDLKVYLGGVEEDTDLSTVSEDMIVDMEMVKTADGWRLTEFAL